MLEKIRRRGILNAGVSLGFRGFSFCEEGGSWCGFDVDLARAVAAGVLGDAALVHYVPLQSAFRFTALNKGVIDIGTYNSSMSLSRELQYGIKFVQPILYDVEKFLTRKSNLGNGKNKFKNLTNNSVGIIHGSSTEGNLVDYFTGHGLNYEFIKYQSSEAIKVGYEAEECSVLCLDSYLLESIKNDLKNPIDHLLLDDVTGMEVMSPTVLARELQWSGTVSWIMKSLIKAEDLSLGKNSISARQKHDLKTSHFLNPSDEICNYLQLPNNFTRQIIDQVGNYGEIFDNNLGSVSGLNLARNENRLRADGGLLYSPPFI
jgi:polar amino acid transport system substrate-binding protein